MRLEAYFDSNSQLAIPVAVHGKENDCFLEPSNASISHKKEGALSSSPAHSLFSIVKMAELNANLASKTENPTSLDKSLKTVGMSSLLADANLLLSRAFLDKSGSAKMEPYLNSPSSVMPLSSSNLSSLLMDASPVCHQNTLVDQSNQQGHKRKKLQQMAGSAAFSEPKSQSYLLSLPIGMKQEPNTLTQVLNKSRMDTNSDYLLKQQMVQQPLTRQDVDTLQNNNPHLKGLIQHWMQNQLLQQILHSTQSSHGACSSQSELQVKNQLPQQATHQISSIQSDEDGICSRRLSQYIHNLRHRPKDNSIDYWRKFISEFYAPGAKERWCLSSYENIGKNVLGSLGSMDAWCCDICGTKSGKGFEASFEILPRLCKMKFESGALEEILFVEFPRECRFSSGMMMLEYRKAIQESVYKQFRVVREGKLRVIFRHDLKILSWQFCVRHHEEYVPRQLISPKVNQLICATHKYQSSPGNLASAAELQENCNMFLKSAHQLKKHIDLPILNDLGFPKKHIRCLQIAEIVNSMKDLMDFSFERRIGPIESLQTYPAAGTKTDVQASVQTMEQETVEQGSYQDVHADGIRSISVRLGPENHRSDTRMTSSRVVAGLGGIGSIVARYHQKIARENRLNILGSSPLLEQSCSMGRFSQRTTFLPFQDQSYNPGPLHNSTLSRLPSSQTSEASKNIQQQMFEKWLQEMLAGRRGKGVQNTLGMQKDRALHEFNANIMSGLPLMARGRGTVRDGSGSGTVAASAWANLLANVPGSGAISRTASNTSTLEISGNNPTIKREPDLPEFHMAEAFMGGQFSKK